MKRTEMELKQINRKGEETVNPKIESIKEQMNYDGGHQKQQEVTKLFSHNGLPMLKELSHAKYFLSINQAAILPLLHI